MPVTAPIGGGLGGALPPTFSAWRVARAAAAFVVAGGVAVLVGWSTGIEFLTHVAREHPPMVPSTALGFVLLGLALWWSNDGPPHDGPGRRRWRVPVLVGIVLALNLLTAAAYLSRFDPGLDRSLARLLSPAATPVTSSPQTVLLFVGLGFALLIVHYRIARHWGAVVEQMLAMTTVFVSVLILFAYLFNLTRVYYFRDDIGVGMAMHTALLFLVLGVGVLLSRPERGPMAILTRVSVGGRAARRLLLASLLGPLLLGLVTGVAGRLGAYTPHFEILVFAAGNILVFGGAIWGFAHALDRLEEERSRARDELHYAAYFDALTALPNRVQFLDRLAAALADYRNDPTYAFVVLFLDLNRFKIVNDSLGHGVGDTLLAMVSKRLRATLRPGDLLARMSGDEFAILLRFGAGTEQGIRYAEEIHRALLDPFQVAERTISISSSVGIVLSDPQYRRPEEILRDADTATYSAKRAGAPYRVYARSMHREMVEVLDLESGLREGIERREFRVAYQPIVTAGEYRVVGVEALVRWQRSGGRDRLGADAFLPLAEETGLITEIDLQVLRRAAGQILAWRGGWLRTLSVNLSARHFGHPDAAERILAVLDEVGFPPHRLHLELTESGLMRSINEAVPMLRRLQRAGAKIHLDDFGTGYSSLSYLQRLPVDTVKIDRGFVRDLTSEPRSVEFVRAIVDLAKSLGLRVVAEGVETPEQVRLLESFGCDYLQGFLFARPVFESEAERELTGRFLLPDRTVG